MTRQHILFHDADSLRVGRMHVMEAELVADEDVEVDVDALAAAIRDGVEEAPVGLLTRTGLLHIREDRRARLRPAVVVDDEAVAVALSLSVGPSVVWSAVSVGGPGLDQLPDAVEALARLLARDLSAAGDAASRVAGPSEVDVGSARSGGDDDLEENQRDTHS